MTYKKDFFENLGRNELSQIKTNITKEEYKYFASCLKYLLATKKRYVRLSNSNKNVERYNTKIEYIFSNDTITQKTIFHYNEGMDKDCNYEDCTPVAYKMNYNYCKEIVNKVLNSQNEETLSNN